MVRMKKKKYNNHNTGGLVFLPYANMQKRYIQCHACEMVHTILEWHRLYTHNYFSLLLFRISNSIRQSYKNVNTQNQHGGRTEWWIESVWRREEIKWKNLPAHHHDHFKAFVRWIQYPINVAKNPSNATQKLLCITLDAWGPLWKLCSVI